MHCNRYFIGFGYIFYRYGKNRHIDSQYIADLIIGTPLVYIRMPRISYIKHFKIATCDSSSVDPSIEGSRMGCVVDRPKHTYVDWFQNQLTYIPV